MGKTLPFFLFLTSALVFGQKSGSEAIAEKLLKESVVEMECVGLASGFSIDGKIVWEGGAGYSNTENKNPFTPVTRIRIASITKPMTAIAILQLFEKNKIGLDNPIQEYLPDFPVKPEGTITVRNLLNHSSGIDDYQSDKERENQTNYSTLVDAVDYFKNRKLISIPGQEFNYTTYGYVVLGLIIEQVSGLRYEDYMRINIWEPTGMTNTGIEYFGKEYANKSELFHKNAKGKIKPAEPTNLSDRIPGGGVYSCVTDMLKFGNAILNNMLISNRTLETMVEDPHLKKQGNGYGFGWYLYGENPSHGNVFGHNGTQTGASTFLMLFHQKRACVVVLSNTSGAMQNISNITIKLFDVVGLAKKEMLNQGKP